MTCKNCSNIKKNYLLHQSIFVPYNPIIYLPLMIDKNCCCQQDLINKCDACKNNKKNYDKFKSESYMNDEDCCFCNIM